MIVKGIRQFILEKAEKFKKCQWHNNCKRSVV